MLTVLDRIAVAIHIIQFVQKEPQWTYTGIDTLETSTNSIKLQFDDEPQEKFHKRKVLLKQLYDVARQQSHYMKGEKGMFALTNQSSLAKT
jgi:hypothetical protein